MLLVVKKGIRDEMCHCINRYAKVIYVKNYDKNEESSYLKY